jgi:gliding motility associated protien GldN
MKKQFLKWGLMGLVLLGTTLSVDAQRRGRTGRTTTGNQPANEQQQPPATQQTNNNQQPSGYNPYGNLPIEKAPVVGGFNDTIKTSLRMDGAFEKNASMKSRTPLPYDHLRADDALFAERVWREIDIREKINQVFSYKSDEDNGNQRFVNILVNAVRHNGVTPFSADDDRFTTPMDSLQFEQSLSGGGTCDTLPVYNLNDPTKIDKWSIVCNTLNPDEITKFRIKEDWVFDRESSRLVCRIIGIAPMRTIMSPDGKTERGAIPLFWIYYPELRETLTRYEVYNPKNMGNSRMTWEELFESRMFSSYIVKSTIDNSQNRMIRQYVKDPILALLEGDNVKEKIFNFEQDLWSY